METLPCEASAFRFTWNKTEESHSYRRAYKAGTCRLRFSFFANDFDLRSRAVPQPYGCWRSARARHKPRRPNFSRELAALRDFVSTAQSKGL